MSEGAKQIVRPMMPHTFDSTMLSAFRSCPQKFFRSYVEHWKPKAESVHLVAGGAFAKGVEVARMAYYVEGLPRDDAEAAGMIALMKAYGDFECPSDSAKSLERMCGALEFYYANYPFDSDPKTPIFLPDGKRGIEFSFAEPLDILHPVSGDPILYTGRADMIADFAGSVFVVDEKTTTSLGASWSRQWEMRGQFTGYIWACQQIGVKPAGAIVRGVSILKTKFDTLEAITYRSEYEVERWLQQSIRDIKRAMTMWQEGYWDYAIDGACGEYGGCNMTRICKSSTPEDWLPMSFQKRVWDPLARKELTVEEWEASWGHQP